MPNLWKEAWISSSSPCTRSAWLQIQFTRRSKLLCRSWYEILNLLSNLEFVKPCLKMISLQKDFDVSFQHRDCVFLLQYVVMKRIEVTMYWKRIWQIYILVLTNVVRNVVMNVHLPEVHKQPTGTQLSTLLHWLCCDAAKMPQLSSKTDQKTDYTDKSNDINTYSSTKLHYIYVIYTQIVYVFVFWMHFLVFTPYLFKFLQLSVSKNDMSYQTRCENV